MHSIVGVSCCKANLRQCLVRFSSGPFNHMSSMSILHLSTCPLWFSSIVFKVGWLKPRWIPSGNHWYTVLSAVTNTDRWELSIVKEKWVEICMHVHGLIPKLPSGIWDKFTTSAGSFTVGGRQDTDWGVVVCWASGWRVLRKSVLSIVLNLLCSNSLLLLSACLT